MGSPTQETAPAPGREFVEFCIDGKVLRFGDFKLRSGRQSPYFFNFGAFSTGHGLLKLGQYYAKKIVDLGIKFDTLFGPAYKGIPIATSIASSLCRDHDRSVDVSFNRKEPKDHGEGGSIMGCEPHGRVLLVDDVITSGSAASEMVDFLANNYDVEVIGLLVGLDRQEHSPLRERLEVHSVANLNDVLDHLGSDSSAGHYLQAMREYIGASKDVSAIR